MSSCSSARGSTQASSSICASVCALVSPTTGSCSDAAAKPAEASQSAWLADAWLGLRFRQTTNCLMYAVASVSTANLGLVTHHCCFTHVPCAVVSFGPEAECKVLNAKRTLKQVCLAVTEARSERAATAHTSSLRTES